MQKGSDFVFIKERIILLNNNKECILRAPREEDAKSLIELLKCVCDETPFLVSEADEINYTIEGEKAFIRKFNESLYDFMIVIEVEGKIVGNSSIMPVANKRKEIHRCELGIAIMKDYWGLSIGRQVIELAMEAAKLMGYEQIELDVVSGNTGAISLYNKLGFEEIGNIPYAIKLDDGTYFNDIKMMKRLTDISDE